MPSRKRGWGVPIHRFRWRGLLCAALCAGIASFAAAAERAAKPEKSEKICVVEAREYPGRDPAMWDGLYAARNGQVYTALITEGESAHVYVYDPAKDSNEMLFDMAEVSGERGKGIRTPGKIHNKPVEDNEGNIYWVTLNNGAGPRNIEWSSWPGGYWFKYDPKAKKLENMGMVAPSDGLYPLAIDRQRQYLFGVGFTGYFFRFDIQKRQTKNLGRVAGWDICRNIFCDDEGNVFGSFPPARVWKYDAKTEKVIDLNIRMPFDPAAYPTQLITPGFDRSYEWRAVAWDSVDKVAYGVTCGSGSILFRYDPKDGPEGKFTPLTRVCDSQFLTPGADPLGPARPDIPYSTLSFAVDSQHKKIWYLPSSRPYTAEHYIETFGNTQPHHLICYDIAKKERIDCGELRTSDGRRVFGSEAASIGPDGTLYFCAQAEVNERAKATRRSRSGNTPVALHLMIYKPEGK